MPSRPIPLTEGIAPTVSIQRPVLLIGRLPECDVRLDLPQVSRRHRS
jgi:pSer/pThr/pTyr-binding forkhead associated (FHA) protein